MSSHSNEAQQSQKLGPADTHIVRAAIHPGIGIARVGNSDEFLIGPEIAEPAPLPPGSYRDAKGALKREAARFRIYGYNTAGHVVRELTAACARIRWSVHAANKKAAWYQWAVALDIPEASSVALPLRNAAVNDRSALTIDAGEQSISGANTKGVTLRGIFSGTPVTLGELQTDEFGRLLFLPATGVSASPSGNTIFDPKMEYPFANADGWYDDVADGPVTANVEVDGRSIPVESAWVVTAPPNYAPAVKGVRTLYDLLFDLYVQAGWISPPATVKFKRDVYPILKRLSELQWVNHGFASQFGHSGPLDFLNADYIARLRTPKDQLDIHAELRWRVLNSFRGPKTMDGNQLPWPWIYGDAMQVLAGNSPRQNAAITATQESILRAWAKGDFEDDWHDAQVPAVSLDDIPLQDRPAMLDRAALDFCLADAFHPGCEVTWPIRHITMFAGPFRIRPRPLDAPEPHYGDKLTQQKVLAANGPLHVQGPGDLTRWMGLPWQADTAYCRAGYDRSYDLYLPSFWPARVPNHVLSPQNYAVALDNTQPTERRIAAFTVRSDWFAPLRPPAPLPDKPSNTAYQMNRMVQIFGSMGLVETREGPRGDIDLPSQMMVASYGPAALSVGPAAIPVTKIAAAKTEQVPLSSAPNFDSDAEAAGAPSPVQYGKAKG